MDEGAGICFALSPSPLPPSKNLDPYLYVFPPFYNNSKNQDPYLNVHSIEAEEDRIDMIHSENPSDLGMVPP